MWKNHAAWMALGLCLAGSVAAWGQPGMGGGNAVNISAGKALINATDEEWKVISPLILNIVAARQAITVAQNGGTSNNAGGRMGPGGMGNGSFSGPGDTAAGDMGGRGGPGGGMNSGIVATPAAGSTTVTLTPEQAAAMAAEDAKVKEAATTQAIKKANAEILAAQKELRQLLTPEQQAVVVKAGYLPG